MLQKHFQKKPSFPLVLNNLLIFQKYIFQLHHKLLQHLYYLLSQELFHQNFFVIIYYKITTIFFCNINFIYLIQLFQLLYNQYFLPTDKKFDRHHQQLHEIKLFLQLLLYKFYTKDNVLNL